eukprot:CAMPEP_0197635604 /NCGR_PEP_ID=MMETSP1338-20131121/11371_1 /TAXON_ID=43686 ORGANISM="Pelagodinium beii, Strain RCC1491" /NCGR_SAMPLE_ID=MMETSP1338 /ASSEMBLY_ACC=CAM_ASM_000754 /LENGTH=155 /DNA_ID=CAMNT_0043207691 /DNA_START=49 /DNA_END=516 /DNA_ORIENTATION=-
MAGVGTTTTWRVGETSQSRLSFNSLVTHKSYDMPEDMWKSYYMGRQATMGPEYIPNGVMARVLSGSLAATRPDEHKPVTTPMYRTGTMLYNHSGSLFEKPHTAPSFGSRSIHSQKLASTASAMLESPKHSSGTPLSGRSGSSGRSLQNSFSTPLL